MQNNPNDLIEMFASECGVPSDRFVLALTVSVCLLMENQPLLKNFILPNIKQAIKEGLV